LLFLIVLLGGDRRTMKERVSGRISRALCWTATASMTVAAIVMVVSVWILPLLH
jgi:hypothetical protein